MGTKQYYVEETTCDQCGRKVVVRDKEDFLGQLPKGWVELTAREFDPDVTRGNERLFADLCSKCYSKLPFLFHTASEGE